MHTKLWLNKDEEKVMIKKFVVLKCNNYTKIQKPWNIKQNYKKLFLSSICNMCDSTNDEIFREEESIDILVTLKANMTEENKSYDFRFKIWIK